MTDYREALRIRRARLAGDSPAAVQAAIDDTSMIIAPGEPVDMVTQADIARRYGVSRAAVAQWLPLDGWPRPVIEAGRTRLWDAAEVDQWVGQRRGHDPEGQAWA